MDDPSREGDGTDQRLSEVLAAYLEAADAGWAPARRSFLARYPDLAPALEEFFKDQDQVAHLAESLPAPSSSEAGGPGEEGPATDEAATLSQHGARTDPLLDDAGSFNDYEVLGEIARGGMGVVYRARQRSLDRVVALKRIKAGQFASPHEVRRFLDEGRRHAGLDHPHIVPVYDAGEHQGRPYFTMKLIEGGDLGKHLPRLTKDPKAAVALLVKVSRAVHYAHQHGVLHRDLKPSNILLDSQGQPLVSDFGLSKAIQTGAAPAESAGVATAGYAAPEQVAEAGELPPTQWDGGGASGTGVVGTPAFMPPEQAAGRKAELTTAADVYGLGAILYEMLTGRPPFRGATRLETLMQVLKRAPERPGALRRGVNRDLEAICLKCLEKQPEKRYGSALALAEDLERWLQGRIVLARPRPWPVRAWRAVRRNLILSAVMAAGGCAAAVAFFLLYWMNPERPRWEAEWKLSAGEPVTLIDESGRPPYGRWLWPEDLVMESASQEAPYRFSSADWGRLLLAPTVPARGYRLTAKVQHDQVIRDNPIYVESEAGIYFAYDSKGQQSYWCEVAFADVGELAIPPGAPHGAKTALVEFRAVHYTNRPAPEPDHRQTATIQPKEDALFRPDPSAWRTLVVEVTPDVVRVYWDGGAKPIWEVTPAGLQQLCRQFRQDQATDPVPTFAFTPRGGVGVFVHRGTASFQQVVVEPLK
jgi:serine/threonine-protein kinase